MMRKRQKKLSSSQFYLHDPKSPLAAMAILVHETGLDLYEQSGALRAVPVTHDFFSNLEKKDEIEKTSHHHHDSSQPCPMSKRLLKPSMAPLQTCYYMVEWKKTLHHDRGNQAQGRQIWSNKSVEWKLTLYVKSPSRQGMKSFWFSLLGKTRITYWIRV